MKIGTEWEIKADDLNVILYRKKMRKKKNGDVCYIWGIVGYFANVANALHELVRQKVRDTELKDLKSVVAEIKKLEEMIATALSASTRLATP